LLLRVGGFHVDACMRVGRTWRPRSLRGGGIRNRGACLCRQPSAGCFSFAAHSLQ